MVWLPRDFHFPPDLGLYLFLDMSDLLQSVSILNLWILWLVWIPWDLAKTSENSFPADGDQHEAFIYPATYNEYYMYKSEINHHLGRGMGGIPVTRVSMAGG